ncbi:MAG TPA: Gfo/Idh/MocA family oxidoreductase [Micromonosporaceae bacterium]|nr:Gfo/Idh/MocA family oxidoreductase [Micromonosporaceae bacterium]
MTEPIRWGVVATGGIATSFVTDLARVPDAEVVAVASRSDDSAGRFATENQIAHPYGTWDALAADPDVEIVYVAGPHPAHHPAARMMLDAGKAVLCEKPLTVNAAQAEDLIAVARERRVFLAEAMWTRTLPAVRRAVELVADGAIGQVAAVTADFSFASGVGPEHRLRNPVLGGGALLDVGVYVLALAQLFLGTPDDVTGYARMRPEGVDAGTAILLGYRPGRDDMPSWRADHAYAALTCASDVSGASTATISGTEGRIEIPPRFHRPEALDVWRGLEHEHLDLPIEGHGLRFPAIEAMRCMRAGLIESPLLPHGATLAVMRTMDQIRRQAGIRYADET